MKDLKHPTSEHPIESKLYSGNGSECMYQLLGDNQVTRWLSKLCEETWWSWAMNEIDRIPWEGFESTTTKDVDSREVWWEKE